MEIIKIIATVDAVTLALTAYIPYLIDMFRGKKINPIYILG